MNLKYGKIEIDNIVWLVPTVISFFSWRDDFFKIPNSEKFNVYLTGSFLDKLLDNVGTPTDIDIILSGNHNIEDIEDVIYQGTKIGIEKYGIFFDIHWDDKVSYNPYTDGETKTDEIYIHSNKWIVDGEIKREYKSAVKITNSLYKITWESSSQKQIDKMKSGFIYKKPLLINY
jgi:hypothetical protein